MHQWASALQTFPWERLCMNYINYFSNKDQSSASSSDRWTVGFRKRFILRLLLLTRPGHSDLGFLSAEWTSFTERTGKGTHPSRVLSGEYPRKWEQGAWACPYWRVSHCLGQYSGLPHQGRPGLASCGEHCCARPGRCAGSSGRADPTGCFVLPPDDGRASEPAETPWVWGIWHRGGVSHLALGVCTADASRSRQSWIRAMEGNGPVQGFLSGSFNSQVRVPFATHIYACIIFNAIKIFKNNR